MLNIRSRRDYHVLGADLRADWCSLGFSFLLLLFLQTCGSYDEWAGGRTAWRLRWLVRLRKEHNGSWQNSASFNTSCPTLPEPSVMDALWDFWCWAKLNQPQQAPETQKTMSLKVSPLPADRKKEYLWFKYAVFRENCVPGLQENQQLLFSFPRVQQVTPEHEAGYLTGRRSAVTPYLQPSLVPSLTRFCLPLLIILASSSPSELTGN